MKRRDRLMDLYRTLLEALGPSGWWPAKTPMGVLAGAVLCQNTAWPGAARAVDNLAAQGLLDDPAGLLRLPGESLESLIRPAGHFRVKARRLLNLMTYLETACGFDLAVLAERDTAAVREDLLGVSGIGPETADSILLYALEMPSFVVDAYTRRILSRHGLAPEDAHYDELRDLFMDALDPDPALFNEFHALLVRTGKLFCKPGKPLCGDCPLRSWSA